MPPKFKKALVEQVFRTTWEQNAATSAAEEVRSYEEDDDSDDERADGLSGASRVVKINQDALKLSCEYLKLFVVEAFQRAQMEAMIDDSEQIKPRHIEQIVAQLLLDF
ncbi:TPA: hypothetical protein N0F65_012047 [Lagenidium giganteum]|uniref:Centromere protein X n=1 Tax=Lagenidium giganteum TaxID=4803 RepID=A0AAV2YWK0_9STRA|nr:TPA: hypothetical protein N0F65_012047 [Lagenidium giganteum]